MNFCYVSIKTIEFGRTYFFFFEKAIYPPLSFEWFSGTLKSYPSFLLELCWCAVRSYITPHPHLTPPFDLVFSFLLFCHTFFWQCLNSTFSEARARRSMHPSIKAINRSDPGFLQEFFILYNILRQMTFKNR